MTTMIAPTLQCQASKLASSMAPIISLIPDTPIMPSLGYVILASIDQHTITITGGSSNQRMHVALSSGLEVSSEEPFLCVVEAGPLYQLLRACGHAEIQLVCEQKSMSFISESSSVSFPTIPANSYPSLGLDKSASQTMRMDEASAQKLSEILANLADYTKKSNAEFGSPLAGIWLTESDGYLRATAFESTIGSDDHLPIEYSLSEPLFIANDAIPHMVKIMASGDSGEARIELSANWLGLHVGETTFWTRRQAVTPLPLEQLWPKPDDTGFTGIWVVEKVVLIQSLKRIGSLPGLPVKQGVSHLAEFNANDGFPVLTYNFESYHADEHLGYYSGDEPTFQMGIGIDCKKLLTVASSFSGDTLSFSLNPTNERQRVLYVNDESSNKRALFMLSAANLH